ncbi:hypothetical protein VTN02DRAFT_1969 [Thermoascus thermophilus]
MQNRTGQVSLPGRRPRPRPQQSYPDTRVPWTMAMDGDKNGTPCIWHNRSTPSTIRTGRLTVLPGKRETIEALDCVGGMRPTVTNDPARRKLRTQRVGSTKLERDRLE